MPMSARIMRLGSSRPLPDRTCACVTQPSESSATASACSMTSFGCGVHLDPPNSPDHPGAQPESAAGPPGWPSRWQVPVGASQR